MPKKKENNSELKRLVSEIENTYSGMHLLELKPLISKYLKGGEN